MKHFINVLIIVAILLIGFNLTQINFSDPFGDESIVGAITVLAGLCTILLLTILKVSRKIDETVKKKR
jgi:hypothetical protein